MWDIPGPGSHDLFVFIKVELNFKNRPSIRFYVEETIYRHPAGTIAAIMRSIPFGIFRKEGQWMFITNTMKKIIPRRRRRKILILLYIRSNVLR
jgi:hypothetical protein